jgi:hypothetical protein
MPITPKEVEHFENLLVFNTALITHQFIQRSKSKVPADEISTINDPMEEEEDSEIVFLPWLIQEAMTCVSSR